MSKKRGRPPIDIGGQRFGRLVAIEKIPAEKDFVWKSAIWQCQCDCGNVTTVKHGNLKKGNTKSCGCLAKESAAKIGMLSKFKPKKKLLKILPKILLLDIETSPMEVYTWSLFEKGYKSPGQIIKDWAILTWSAKWLFDSEVHSACVTPKEARLRRDASIIKGIWKLMDEADIVVAHYGNVFDIRKLNTRFLANNLQPPSPYQSIDTVKETKKTFAISSYKLEYLNELFKLQPKLDTSFSLWKRCVKGNADALKKMEEYNRHDVTALEELYLYIRAWIKSHPNTALYMDTDKSVCPNCGNSKLSWGGYYYTPAGRYAAFRCKTCGGIGRSRYNDVSGSKLRVLARSVAR